MKEININLIPGDGIGIDVIHEGKKTLEALAKLDGGLHFDFHTLPWSCEYYLTHGVMMPDDGLKILADCDAILLGAVGFPGVPDAISARDLLFPIRLEFQQYVNMRPIKLLPGLDSPLKSTHIDFVVVRENSEGEYCGRGRIENDGTPQKTVIQEAVFTQNGTERIMRYAYEYARKTGAKSVISATKSNALNYSMVFWDAVQQQVEKDFPDIQSRKMHIDALTGYFIMQPEKIEVVVASNLFGDILTDLGSAMLGSIGISPSGNINPTGKYPSMFEPIHGSAPDIAGKGIANPLGTLWACEMMLRQLHLTSQADLLMSGICEVLQARKIRTPDIGGTATTSEMTDAIISAMFRNAK
ncbi:MAG: isocitrate/isopropylmalate family dehydrogenase [Planctomycetia bacterium]|nr:isocitrate/isopropylmalate family dehydrogenase [Planctomycetia bacterium]